MGRWQPPYFPRKPPHSSPFVLSCDATGRSTIGPILFEQAATADVYRELITTFKSLVDDDEQWLLGSTTRGHCITADDPRILSLTHCFSKLVVPSISGPNTVWFLYLGNMNVNMYKTTPHSKQNIQLCTAHITRVFSELHQRVKAFICRCGGHFRHLIKHSFCSLAITDLFMTVQCGRVCYGPYTVTERTECDPYTTEDDVWL